VNTLHLCIDRWDTILLARLKGYASRGDILKTKQDRPIVAKLAPLILLAHSQVSDPLPDATFGRATTLLRVSLAVPTSSRCISQQPAEKGTVVRQLFIAVAIFLSSQFSDTLVCSTASLCDRRLYDKNQCGVCIIMCVSGSSRVAFLHSSHGAISHSVCVPACYNAYNRYWLHILHAVINIWMLLTAKQHPGHLKHCSSPTVLGQTNALLLLSNFSKLLNCTHLVKISMECFTSAFASYFHHVGVFD